jgi:hypothetical protein
MYDLEVPYFDKNGKVEMTEEIGGGQYSFFEPRPYDKFEDGTLEGCLRQFAKVENMFDKNNLYFCE